MRFGLALPHYDSSFAGRPASWDAVRDLAVAAERSGFDSLWVSDHLFLDWGKYGGPSEVQGSLEAWTTMAGVAAATSRARVGSLVLCNDFRNPALLAKMAATLDLLSGGRLELGIGAGWYEAEYRAAGIEFSSAGKRIDRLGEAVEIVRRLLAGEELDFSGEHYELKGAICRPGPSQQPRPPVWVGGKGDKLLHVAASVADGWNFSWLGSFESYRERSRKADRECERRGRDPKDLRRSVGAYVLAGKDDADANRRFERLVERTLPGVLGQVSWEEFKNDRIAGSADDVAERLAGLKDLGVEEVVVSLGALPFQVADVEDVLFFGEQVVPAVG